MLNFKEICFPFASPLTQESPSSKRQIHEQWKAFVAKEDASASCTVARNFLLGKPLKNGFTPITNPTKLANGQREYYAFERALSYCLYSNEPWRWFSSSSSHEKTRAELKEAWDKEKK